MFKKKLQNVTLRRRNQAGPVWKRNRSYRNYPKEDISSDLHAALFHTAKEYSEIGYLQIDSLQIRPANDLKGQLGPA